MNKDKNVLDQYAEAVRSGGRSISEAEPTIIPPTKNNKKEIAKIVGGIILAVLLIGTSGFMLYKALKTNKPQKTEKEFFADIGWPEDLTIETEPHYTEVQASALEEIRAWERLSREVIHKFFNEPIPKGYKRRLCISIGPGDKKCASIDAESQQENNLIH